MKLRSTGTYRTQKNLKSCVHQPAPFGSMLCIRAKAAWSANRPTSRDLRHYAAGGASAIRR